MPNWEPERGNCDRSERHDVCLNKLHSKLSPSHFTFLSIETQTKEGNGPKTGKKNSAQHSALMQKDEIRLKKFCGPITAGHEDFLFSHSYFTLLHFSITGAETYAHI